MILRFPMYSGNDTYGYLASGIVRMSATAPLQIGLRLMRVYGVSHQRRECSCRSYFGPDVPAGVRKHPQNHPHPTCPIFTLLTQKASGAALLAFG